MNVIAKTLAKSADRALLDAGREHARIAVLLNEVERRSEELGEAYRAALLEWPDVARWRESDLAPGLQQPGRYRDGEFIPSEDGHYTIANSWDLRSRREDRALIPGNLLNHPKEGPPIPDGEPVGELGFGHILILRTSPARPEVVARIDEILAAIDWWHEEQRRITSRRK
jgi:hypothetical protein